MKAKVERAHPLAFLTTELPGRALGKPIYLKDLPALTAATFKNGSGVFFAPDTGQSFADGFNGAEWLQLTAQALDWIPRALAEQVAATLEIETKFSPPRITARENENGNQLKNLHANVTVRNAGDTGLFNVSVNESLPEGFVLAEGNLTAEVERLEAGGSASLVFSAQVPTKEVADYTLTTTVTARDPVGGLHTVTKSAALSVEVPPGHRCVEPGDHPGKGDEKGKGHGKGKALKCERISRIGGGGGRPDCPPGWLKHSQDGACQPPGQGGGNGGGSGNGQGGGGSQGGGQGNGQGAEGKSG